jgi:hypothetical protein
MEKLQLELILTSQAKISARKVAKVKKAGESEVNHTATPAPLRQ